MSIAIACAAGSFRGAFIHGVLSAFEKAHFRADAYAAASSSVIPAAYAALGQVQGLGGAAYWKTALAALERDYDVSRMILGGLATHGPVMRRGLFGPQAARFLVATSAVVTAEAARLTQGEGARRLGQKLLLATRDRDRSWADRHLTLHLFGTLEAPGVLPLTPENLQAVIYASTRMLHAWKLPASVDGRPYVDASYTCSCPAVEMAKLGYRQVIALVPEPGTVYRDIFHSESITSSWGDVPIHVVQPDLSLAELGVDYMTATPAGFETVFRYGEENGAAFLHRF